MIRNEKLESGLEVVHYPVAGTHFVDIALAIGVGSRFEPARLMGISHFTEHILFRGCRRLPTSYELNLAFDRIGDGLNAMTYKEFTMLTTRVPREELGRALDWMAAVVDEPLFQDIETEREIILEEILEELDEKGEDVDLDNISRKRVFGRHPLGYPVLGRPRTLKNITREALEAFHREFYRRSNMVLAVAGGATWEETRAHARARFGVDPVSKAAAAPAAEPAPAAENLRFGAHFVADKGSQVSVAFSFLMPGETHSGELARVFLSRVLDDGISSRLQRTVCERRGLLYNISTGIESFTDVALFDIEFSVSPKKLHEVVEVILAELRLLKEELVGEEEFNVVRERFRRDIYSASESSRAMASLLAEAFLLRLPMPVDPKEYEGLINELTPEAVRNEARKAFRAECCSFVAKGKLSVGQRTAISRLIKKL